MKESSFFIDKSKKQEIEAEQKERIKVKKSRGIARKILVFILALIYILSLYTLIKDFGIIKGDNLSNTIIVYLVGIIGGILILKITKFLKPGLYNAKIFHTFLDWGGSARIVTDNNLETRYSNKIFNDLTENQEISIDGFCQIFDNPDKRKRQLMSLKRLVKDGKPASIEMEAFRNKENVWYKIKVTPIPSKQEFLHWRIDDVTTSHTLRMELNETRERLRNFTESTPVGFFSTDENGKFLFANQSVLKLLSIQSNKDLANYKLHDFIHNLEDGMASYKLINNDNKLQLGEIDLINSEGKILKVSASNTIIEDKEGNIKTCAVIYDLSHEQDVRQELRESQDRFERVFDESPIGICMMDKNYNIDEQNQIIKNIFGSKSTKKSLLEIINQDDKVKVEKWLSKISKGGKSISSIDTSVARGHQSSQLQLYARKLEDSDDIVLHVIDMTELKNLEEQFTQSQKMQAIGQLAGGIAHDFNNLLTAMIGHCDLLFQTHKAGDPSFGDIMQIKNSANRAAGLVRQLLAFSRQQTLQPKVLDVTDTLSELSHLMRRLIGTNINLNIEHGDDLSLVKVDEGQLEQVLINLVVNARDAMADKAGDLIVRTSNFSNFDDEKLTNSNDILMAGDWLKIEVIDQGTGISEENLSKIFDPFFSTKDIGDGTGLGLSTVHGIIHQTGGVISVDTKIGTGTNFIIYLPQHNEEDGGIIEVVEEKKLSQDLTGSAKILFVEDEDAIRKFGTRALTNKGYKVIEAINGEDALQLINDTKPEIDLLITDIMMPEMDGTTLAKHIRELYPNTRIIFISGYAEDKFKSELGDNVAFLPKPFNLKELASKVKEVLDKE